jgi:cobalt-zinc-cadmium efflux system membrane fusion protein
MFNRLLVLTIVLLLPWFLTQAQTHDNHDHQPAEQPATEEQHHDDHDDDSDADGHDDHTDSRDQDAEIDSHYDHDDELIVELTPEAVALAGIELATVSHGQIGSVIELPGEVGFNEDKLTHIAPRFAGIAQQAKYRIGDFVEIGSTMAIVESNESMNSYTITAPMSGWVIERHITPGEFVSEENSIYVIADLSTVWVNLAVYPKDCSRVKVGQTARIKAVGSANSTRGEIEYITPIIDFRTRSASARISLPNPDNAWRPGIFVQATVNCEGQSETLVVERDAVQYLDEERVVFVADGPNRFRPAEVSVGESDDHYTQIVSGLDEGTEYVSRGAFELKAKIVTSNLDAHAGHGH